MTTDAAAPADKAALLSTIAAANARAKSIQVFNCPQCGGQIQLRAAGASMTAVCAHCGTVVDVTDGKLQVVQQAASQMRETILEIGMRGKIAGIIWEVIGYTLKSDKTGVYLWEEYLLFNPYYGFRFLVQMDGHWSFVKMIKKEINKSSFNVEVWLGSHCFRPFLQDQPIVQYVKGEFYWRVKKGDRSRTEDYVCPPYMLSFEFDEGETVISMCNYLEPKEIHDAFQLTRSMPWRKGVGPNQPNPFELGWLMTATFVALGLAVAIHVMTMAASASQDVLVINEVHEPGDQTRDYTSAPFDVPAVTNIRVSSYAPVDNQWAEYGFTLERMENGVAAAGHDMRQAIEYYHGYDSDGAWSEGSQWETEYFSNVPPGTYQIVYDVDSGYFGGGMPMSMYAKMTRGVAPFSNLLIAMVLLLIYPVYEWTRRSGFETKRWSTSDFAPDDS
jgi:hypothetical protein